jgi:peptide chain release factor 3
MSVKHARLNKPLKLNMPLNFFAQERVVVEEAWPGDIVGILDTSGDLRIGDTLCETGRFEYGGVPRFSPEYFAGVTIKDPMKRKHLQKGLDQLSEEGVVQVYRQRGMLDKDPILGAVGALQFEVLKFRLEAEYNVAVNIEKLPYVCARWVEDAADANKSVVPGDAAGQFDANAFERREGNRVLEDRDGQLVVLFRSEWALKWAEDNTKGFRYSKTATLKRGSA